MVVIKQFFNDESGATMVEYVIMVALIAVALIVAVFVFFNALNDIYEYIATEVGTMISSMSS